MISIEFHLDLYSIELVNSKICTFEQQDAFFTAKVFNFIEKVVIFDDLIYILFTMNDETNDFYKLIVNQ